jgi:methylated-DNA-[protein]-cysteine S-methyltransferase
MTYGYLIESPIGPLTLLSDGESITGLYTAGHRATASLEPVWEELALFAEARQQLTSYFARQLREFDLPLSPEGTPFQQRVWQELQRIPYGATVSYGELARRLGLGAGSSRAVGLANGRNPISIVIPCHRVIGTNAALTGYAGGLETKRALLELEGAMTSLGI